MVKRRDRALHKAAEEFKEFLGLFAYLYVAFGALILLKSGILRSAGIDWAPWGLAAIKALLIAKFVLIGRAVGMGNRFKDKPLIWGTIHRSLVFLAFVLVLTVLEEAAIALIHHRPMWQSVSDIGGGNATEFLAMVIVVFLIFFPYFALRSLQEVIGGRALFRLFFVERRGIEVVER